MKPKVFLTRELPPLVMAFLREHATLAVNPEERTLAKPEIIAGLKDGQALLCNITDTIDAGIMDACPGLKVIANFGVGFDNIDIVAATVRKIPVTNTPGVLTEATADLAFGLLLAAARRLGEGERLVRAGRWSGWEPRQLLGADVTGATLGLIGCGRIGRAVARRARAFDLKVISWNRTRLAPEEEAAMGAVWLPFDEVVSQADFLSLHVASTKDTHHLIGDRQFAMMKPSALLINTTRGSVVDEKALVRALQSGRLAGAGLDVFEREPLIEPELLTMENVVLAPHLGSATIGTRTKMGFLAVENLLAACAGKIPPNVVNRAIYD